MRVLRLCSVFEPPATAVTATRFDPIGGMQNHTGELSRGLDRRGVTQMIVTTRPPTAPRVEDFGARGRVLRLGLPVPWARQLYSLPASRLVPRLAASADLIHAHLGEDLAVVPIALFAARRHRLPFVLTVHTSLHHTITVTNPRSALLKILGGRLERWGASEADALIAITRRLAELVMADGVPPERVHLVPPGVQPALFARAAADGDLLADLPRPRVLYLGRFHAQKQVDVLVRAASLLPEAQVVLVGDGNERHALELLSKRLGVSERVHFRGFVPHDQIPGVLRGADVLALPSRYEELGVVMLEAMHAGVPVVASATGGIVDVVEHEINGLLVPPGDHEALAMALRRVLTDSNLADSLAAAGRQRVTRYDWNGLTEEVLTIYEQVLRRHVPGTPNVGK